MRKRIGYGWWAAVWLGGCAPGPLNSEKTLTVFAAASLNDVVTELAENYQRTAPVSLRISTGASGALCTQIEQGAPCDLFLSADPALTRRLLAAGRLRKDAPRTLARNRLVLAVAAQVEPGTVWPEALKKPSVRRIAIADPDTAPAGRYAREALVSLKLWDALQPKLVRAGDVRGAAHYLAWHTVQAAIVYQTDVDATESLTPVYVFDETTHTPIEYVGAVVASGGAAQGDSGRDTRADSARDFLAFLGSAAAAPVWRKYGFVSVVLGK